MLFWKNKSPAATFSAEELPFFLFSTLSMLNPAVHLKWVDGLPVSGLYCTHLCLTTDLGPSFSMVHSLLLVSQRWGGVLLAKLSSNWVGTYYKTLPKPRTSCHFLHLYPKVSDTVWAETWEVTFSAMVVLPNQDINCENLSLMNVESLQGASFLPFTHAALLFHWKEMGFQKQKRGRKSGSEMLCWTRTLTLHGSTETVDPQKPH